MLKIFFLAISVLFETSIYTHHVTGIGGSEIDFNSFQGKKILVVNIATNSSRVGQLGELQQLQQQYGDSLVIVAFPSNSFGHESRSNSEITAFCKSQYNTSFLLASKGSVKGEDTQPFYYWITHQTENGAFGSVISGDFQKYLFDHNGNPLGIFAGSISPLNSKITNAITGTQN